MANNDNKELEKLNRAMDEIKKAVMKMSKTMEEAATAMIKAAKIWEEEQRRKQENMWYKYNPSLLDNKKLMTPRYGEVDIERHHIHSMGDQKDHTVDIHTANIDLADVDASDYQSLLYHDPAGMFSIQKIYCDGRLHSVTKIEKDGTSTDVTEEYRDKEEQS